MARKSRTSSAPSPASGNQQQSDGYQAPPERWQHGSVPVIERDPASSARVQRVGGAVDVMVRGGTLQLRHRAAADRWLLSYEFGVLGASDPEKRGSAAAGDHDAFTVARLDDCSRYFAAKAAVGKAANKLLVLALHERLTLTALTEVLKRDRRAVSGQLEAALERLVEHYHDVDSKRRPRHTIANTNTAPAPSPAKQMATAA